MHRRATRRKLVFRIPAIICLSAASAVFLWYRATEHQLGATGENVVKNSIAAEYQRYHLSRANLSAMEKAKLLSAIQNMKIKSLTARGENKNLVVRVEVEPTKVKPPGLPNVQYYQLKYSSLTGWTSQGKTTAENYYLSNFKRFYN
jgi:hypothetical protein